MVVRMSLTEESEIRIETLLPRLALFVDLAEAPFSHQSRAITPLLQHARDGDVTILQGLSRGAVAPRVAADTRVTGMLAGHQNAA
jgi:hypothetical protein